LPPIKKKLVYLDQNGVERYGEDAGPSMGCDHGPQDERWADYSMRWSARSSLN